jgi:hypothetical protein
MRNRSCIDSIDNYKSAVYLSIYGGGGLNPLQTNFRAYPLILANNRSTKLGTLICSAHARTARPTGADCPDRGPSGLGAGPSARSIWCSTNMIGELLCCGYWIVAFHIAAAFSAIVAVPSRVHNETEQSRSCLLDVPVVFGINPTWNVPRTTIENRRKLSVVLFLLYTILVARERESSIGLIKTILTWASRVSNYLATEGRVVTCELIVHALYYLVPPFVFIYWCSIKSH